jgi:hypothetical protein
MQVVIRLSRRSHQFFPITVEDEDEVDVVEEQEAGSRDESQVDWNGVRVAKIFLNDDLKLIYVI